MRRESAAALTVALAVGVLAPGVRAWRHGPWQRYQPTPVARPWPDARDLYIQAYQALPEEIRRSYPFPTDTARVVAASAPALALLHQAFAYRCRRNPRTARGGSFDYPLRRVLYAVRTQAVAEQRWADAVDASLDVLQLGRDARYFTLSQDLTPVGTLGVGEVARSVEHLTADEARAALARLRSLVASEPSFAELMELGSAAVRDVLAEELCRPQPRWLLQQYGVSPPGSGELDCQRFYLYDWLGLVRGRTWRVVNARLAAANAWARQPYGLKPRLPGDLPGPFLLTVEDLCRQRRLFAREQAVARLFLTALALRVWQAEHGAPPDSLGRLCPALLPAVPLDPFSSQPLRYRADGGRYRLWSAGGLVWGETPLAGGIARARVVQPVTVGAAW